MNTTVRSAAVPKSHMAKLVDEFACMRRRESIFCFFLRITQVIDLPGQVIYQTVIATEQNLINPGIFLTQTRATVRHKVWHRGLSGKGCHSEQATEGPAAAPRFLPEAAASTHAMKPSCSDGSCSRG